MHDLTPIEGFRLSDHATFEMARRQVNKNDVAKVLHAPEQAELVRPGRAVYQSRLHAGKPQKMYLLRVFVDIDCNPPKVVTVYRTSKIEKYWRR